MLCMRDIFKKSRHNANKNCKEIYFNNSNVITYVHNCIQQQTKRSQRFKWYEHWRSYKYAKIRTRRQVKLYVYFVVCFVLTDTYVGLNGYLEYLSLRSSRHVSMFRSVLRLWLLSFNTVYVVKSPD